MDGIAEARCGIILTTEREEVVIGDLAFVPGQTEAPEYISRLLGLRLTLDEQNHLQFYEMATNQRLLDDAEALVLAETLVKDAGLRAEEAEAENARLREELARLRGEQR